MVTESNRRWVAFAALIAASSAAGAQAVLEHDVERRAAEITTRMTPEEKAGQLSQYFVIQQLPPLNKAPEAAVAAGKAGSILMVTDPKETNRLQRLAATSRLGIPLLFGFDAIHGVHTIFPVPLALAASWDPSTAQRAQEVAAAEARAVGVHWVFAPNADIARDPRWGRIVEGGGEDPYLASAMVAAQVRGFQGIRLGEAGHVVAGVKHFAGYGASLGGRDYDEVDLSESTLRNVYLPPFKAAIDAGVGNIMTAYMQLNGVPAVANRWLLTDVLRREWGYRGFVVSDNSAVISLRTQGLVADLEDATVRALKAGAGMEMVPPGQKAAYDALPAALSAGHIDQATVDLAVRRVIETKLRLGLFKEPFVDEERAAAVLARPAHMEAARIAAERSAVLLRNEGGLLPLDRKKLRSVAVMGPMADSAKDTLGPWVLSQDLAPTTTVLAGVRAKLGKNVMVHYSEGVRMPPRTFPSPFSMLDKPIKRESFDETTEIARCVELAKASDVAILVLGEAQDMIGETASRASLDLPGRQQELLDAVTATGKPVVVVLMSARPLNLKDTKAAALLDTFYPGSAGGTAIANLLFGDATPGGKLPFTWIKSASQAPNFYAHLLSHDVGNTDRRYWDGNSRPSYPFGYGLSYSTFSYSDLRTDAPRYAKGAPVTVTAQVSNTGSRTADEVVQLYVHQRRGEAARPVRELKGFQRVTLQAGEKRLIRFILRPADLTYWSSVSKTWTQDATNLDLWVGGDSEAKLTGAIEVTTPDVAVLPATAD